MDNQSSQSTASLTGYMTSLIMKIFRREAEATRLDDPDSTEEIDLPLQEIVDGGDDSEPEQDFSYLIEDLPPPPLDLPGPLDFVPVEQPAFPDPPHAPFDSWGPQEIRPWEQPAGVSPAFTNPPRAPFQMSAQPEIRPWEQQAGVSPAFPNPPRAPFQMSGQPEIRRWEQPAGVRPGPPFDPSQPQQLRPWEQPAGVRPGPPFDPSQPQQLRPWEQPAGVRPGPPFDPSQPQQLRPWEQPAGVRPGPPFDPSQPQQLRPWEQPAGVRPGPPFDPSQPQQLRPWEQPAGVWPGPPFDPSQPQQIRPWEQPAGVWPGPPFDPSRPQQIRPWEQPAGVRPGPPFDPSRPQQIRPWEQQAGVSPAFTYPPGPTFDPSQPQQIRPFEGNEVWQPAAGENFPIIYKAALTGDWEAVKGLFQQQLHLRDAVISSRLETPLHVAVGTEKANDFVSELLKLLPDEALEILDFVGETALHYAARVGNVEAATMLVKRMPDLLYITNRYERLPVQIAAMHSQKKMLTYLIESSDPRRGNNNPFFGDLGVRLLCAVTSSGFFDVALENYPALASSTTADGRNNSALSSLALMPSAFRHGEYFGLWNSFIYSCVPSESPSSIPTLSTAADITDTPNVLKLKGVMSKVVQRIVPQAKSIGLEKVKHQQALKLVNSLCRSISIAPLPYDRVSAIYENAIIIAATQGNHDVVRVIVDYFPTSIFAEDPQTARGIFSLAVAGRHENVFNLIYDMSDRKFNFYDYMDSYSNNFMHLSAVVAPSHKLDLVPGPALQMQRELQWFKEVEKFVHPSRREWLNSQNYTPRALFSEQHQKLKTEGEAWMRSTANSCSVAAALVATIVFAAAFTVPGGLNQETGIPILRNKFAFLVFIISDAVSLFTSLTSLLMFLSILTSRYAEDDFLYVLPCRSSIGLLALFVSVTFMMAAFGAALYLMLVEKDAWLLIPVAALACLPVASFVLLQFPLLIAVVCSTYRPGIFGKKTGKLLY